MNPNTGTQNFGNRYDNSLNIENNGSGTVRQLNNNNQGIEINNIVNNYNNGANSNQRRQQNNSGQGIDSVDRVVDRVWEVMFENQSLSFDNWKTLAERFGIQFERHPNKKNFIRNSLRNQDISWGCLKTALYEMKKNDVVEDLKKKTNLTEGLTTIMEEHKQRLFEETKRKTIHAEFVELAVVESKIVEERWRNNVDEKEFPYLKFNVPRTDYKNISLEELIDQEDCFVVMNGIAGVGKTTLCEKIKHQWSAGRLWNGGNGQPHVPLLLSISCRMINIKKFESITDFLSYLIPDLRDLKLLEDKKALLLMDGADELKGIENLSEDNSDPILKLFYDVINFPVQRFFNNIIITSRPKIASQLRQFCKQKIKILETKNVEISGFTSDSIHLFVKRRFQEKPDILESIMTRIRENSTMEAMSSIPIFLNSYCDLFSDNSSIPTPSTMTELLLYTILNFFRQSYKAEGKKRKDLSVRELTRDEEVVNHVINLAEVSYKTLTEKKVIFFQDDFGIDLEKLNLLEEVGFVSKISDPMEGDIYQYRHLTFQEIFTAIFIIKGNEEFQQNCFKNQNLRDTLPLVSGLEGILKRNSNTRTDHLKTFVQKLTNDIPTYCNVKVFLEGSIDGWRIDPLYYKCQSENIEIPSQHFIDNKMNSLHIDDKSMLLRECKAKLWNYIIPHITEEFSFYLSNIQTSDNIENFARIACKSTELPCFIREDDNIVDWIDFFQKFSNQSEHNTSSVALYINKWENDVTDNYAGFLRNVTKFRLDGKVLLWLKYLVECYSDFSFKIDTLIINADDDDDIMEMIGRLCEYVSCVDIFHHVSDLSKLYEHIDSTTAIISDLELYTTISDVEITRLKNLTFLTLKEHIWDEDKDDDSKGIVESKVENGIDNIEKELRSLFNVNENRELRYLDVEFEFVSISWPDDYFNRFTERFSFVKSVDTDSTGLSISL